MKTPSFVAKNSKPMGLIHPGLPSVHHSSSGSIGKITLSVLVLAAVAGVGFHFIGQPQVSQVSAAEPPPVAEGVPDSAAPAEPSGTPGALEIADAPVASLPAPPPAAPEPQVQVAERAAPKTAPAGMVYLARRMTITRETGITSLPEGTLVIVKSRNGGKVQASIRGLSLELGEGDYVTVYDGE